MLKQSFLKKAFPNPLGNKPTQGTDEDASQPFQSAHLGSITAQQKDETVKTSGETAKETAVAYPLQRKAALTLALLGASSGLAFTQVTPANLKEALPGQNASAPLKRAGDPPIEPLATNTRSLFLTNEIFHRKIEAIAQVPLNQRVTASTGQKSEAQTSQASKSSSNAKKAPSSKPTNATAPQPSQPEKVVAAAPPAPKVAASAFSGTTIDNVLEMRVALARDVSAISLATSSSGTITDLDGNPLKALSPESAVIAEINGGITVDGQPMPSAFWVYPEDGGYVAIGDSWYRGRALVALRERGLIAVNYVLLGDYLYSVVGTEVSPTWPIESMKAQAVAARSYALTHNISPASEAYFDLDNTQRFQAYKGISREADTTIAAVQATSGEFISHDGGIVESLYAASQAIVDDAHKGSGMSQLGAKDLAHQGYSYTEILAHYYPGTGLGRIETDAQ